MEGDPMMRHRWYRILVAMLYTPVIRWPAGLFCLMMFAVAHYFERRDERR